MTYQNMKYPARFPLNFEIILNKNGFKNAVKFDETTVLAEKNGEDFYFQFPKYPYLEYYTLRFHLGHNFSFEDFLSELPPIAYNYSHFIFVHFLLGEFNLFTVNQWYDYLVENKANR